MGTLHSVTQTHGTWTNKGLQSRVPVQYRIWRLRKGSFGRIPGPRGNAQNPRWSVRPAPRTSSVGPGAIIVIEMLKCLGAAGGVCLEFMRPCRSGRRNTRMLCISGEVGLVCLHTFMGHRLLPPNSSMVKGPWQGMTAVVSKRVWPEAVVGPSAAALFRNGCALCCRENGLSACTTT